MTPQTRKEGRWPLFECVYRRDELFTDMMRLTGVNPLSAARLDKGEAIIEARHNCLMCPNLGACHNWMEASEGLPVPPDFCPNKDFLARCKKSV